MLEILSRGYTHWSMGVAGGICLAGLSVLHCLLCERNFFLQCAVGAAMITCVEFVAGVIVNLWLGLAVWSYASEAFNFLGQICPLFTFYWFLLCIPIMGAFSLPHALALLRSKKAGS